MGAAAQATRIRPPVKWPAEAIWESLAPTLAGFTVEVLPQVDSTNSELMRRARAGQLEPVLLVAERQTAGRGRMGRAWHSDAESDEGISTLTFSLGLSLSLTDWSGLSLAVGVALAEALHPALRLKWPNDIWLNDRKLAGVLIETASFGDSRYAIIGVGINVLPRGAHGMSTSPAWLGECIPGVDAPATLLRVALPLGKAVLAFADTGFAPFRERFAALDALAGRGVALTDGSEGVAQGVDARGALLVHTSQGAKAINSSEISVRPTAISMADPAQRQTL